LARSLKDFFGPQDADLRQRFLDAASSSVEADPAAAHERLDRTAASAPLGESSASGDGGTFLRLSGFDAVRTAIFGTPLHAMSEEASRYHFPVGLRHTLLTYSPTPWPFSFSPTRQHFGPIHGEFFFSVESIIP
jgi:hypothetical protein